MVAEGEFWIELVANNISTKLSSSLVFLFSKLRFFKQEDCTIYYTDTKFMFIGMLTPRFGLLEV